jgi:hypothetical protein
MTELKTHKHTCPICKQEWLCALFATEDTDCRWFTEIICPDCFLAQQLLISSMD